jgi:hypothetical protein
MRIWIIWIFGRSASSFLRTDYPGNIFGRNVEIASVPRVIPLVPLSPKVETTVNTVMRRRRGSIVYKDKWRGYDSLMFCGYKHLNIEHRYKFKQGKVYINGIEGFWSFAKERLIKHHRISRRKFLYYIKEREWRCTNRGRDLFEAVVDLMLYERGLGVDGT